MTKKPTAETARASPQPKRKYRLSPRFMKGGEVLQFDRIEVVKEEKSPKEDSTEVGEIDITDNQPRKEPKGSISVMLILQILTLAVAVIALL